MSVLRINIVLFGIGKIGSALIQQVVESQLFFLEKYDIELRFPIITSSTIAFFENENAINTWESNFTQIDVPFRIENIIDYTRKKGLQNLIAVDATKGSELVKSYISLIKNGFNIVAANRTANIVYQDYYTEIRRNLKKYNKDFLYETSIIEGLPIVNTLRELHHSGENITKIRGVFSSSLSYIFNRFSDEEYSFSNILQDAEKLGYTNIDSREDLSGKEVGQKVLILARELGARIEFKDIKITPILLPNLNNQNTKSEYNKNKKSLDESYGIFKLSQTKNHVLRYVGEFDIYKNTIEVKLISEPINSAIGQLKNTENLIEIYTKENGTNPIIIQGGSTGKEIAAKALIKDILKISNQMKQKEALLLYN